MPTLKEVRRMKRRALTDDMPLRNDLLLSDTNIITGIMRDIRPASPAVFFSSFLGNTNGADDSQWEAAPQGLGVGFIRLKEIKEIFEPLRVTKNSLVPATIQAQVPFEFSADFALDRDENFLAKNQKSYFRVISSRPYGNGADITAVLDAQPGETASGALFGIGNPINHNYGNSKGEGSTDSNTFMGDAIQSNTFFNPMKITRRVLGSTGSSMADETEVYAFRMEDEQGVFKDYHTDIPIKFFEKIVREMARQFMYSTANFDPLTRKIHGISNTGKYHERPSYAGIYQQLDYVQKIYTHQMRSQSYRQLLAVIDSILQKMYYANGSQKATIVAACQGAGAQVLRQAFREAITGKYGVSIQVTTTGSAPKIDVGFELGDYVTDYGRVLIYDMGVGAQDGEFDKVSFNNIEGNPRDWEINFMPALSTTPGRGRKKPVDIYYRRSSKSGYGDVNRGLVFGVSHGLTGQNNGMSFEQLQDMQEASIQKMMQNKSFAINSTFDGNEYHVLYESVPYIDITNIVKLQLIV